ncbi:MULTISPECIES: type VII secretion-associated serine protease mycosin [Thermocrispum]|nr:MULTISPECIES: type VII secretion-associated serine protease mycosin [Thermocrispum]
MKRLFALIAVALIVFVPAVPAHAQEDQQQEDQQQEECLPPPTTVERSVPWAQRQLQPERVWPLTKGKGVVVGVVDTGVDGSIPQLKGQVLPGIDATTSGSGGRADDDCFGHGTFVAGIIAAKPVDGTGYVGVAPGVKILPVRCAVTDEPGKPDSLTPESMARGIRAAVDAGADVINVSASTTEQNEELADAVRYAASKDVVIVASAANTTDRGIPATYPAAYPPVIAVGAVDENGRPADFSQTGPFVALVAPGVKVHGLGRGGHGHWTGSGTSYSAPFVTGVAALVRAYHPHLTAEQVKYRLLATASRPATAPDPALGWGMVDPYAAVSAVLLEEENPEPELVHPPSPAPPDIPERDEIGPWLAVGGTIGVVVLATISVGLVAMCRVGRLRKFRPARVLRVKDTESHRAPASGPPQRREGPKPGRDTRRPRPGRRVVPAGPQLRYDAMPGEPGGVAPTPAGWGFPAHQSGWQQPVVAPQHPMPLRQAFPSS